MEGVGGKEGDDVGGIECGTGEAGLWRCDECHEYPRVMALTLQRRPRRARHL